MNLTKSLKYGLILTLVTTAITGCNFGSDDDGGGEPTTYSSVSGTAVDGYLVGSTACLDINANNVCDDGEPFGLSSDNGTYTFDVASTVSGVSDAKVLVTGGIDSSTGEAFIGIMKAPYDATATSIVVSPLTTLVAEVATSNSAADIEAAKTALATSLGLNAEDLTKDPIALAAESGNSTAYKVAMQVQKTLEVVLAAEVGNETEQTTIAQKFGTIASSFATKLQSSNSTSVKSKISEVVTSMQAESTSTTFTTDLITSINTLNNATETTFENLDLSSFTGNSTAIEAAFTTAQGTIEDEKDTIDVVATIKTAAAAENLAKFEDAINIWLENYTVMQSEITFDNATQQATGLPTTLSTGYTVTAIEVNQTTMTVAVTLTKSGQTHSFVINMSIFNGGEEFELKYNGTPLPITAVQFLTQSYIAQEKSYVDELTFPSTGLINSSDDYIAIFSEYQTVTMERSLESLRLLKKIPDFDSSVYDNMGDDYTAYETMLTNLASANSTEYQAWYSYTTATPTFTVTIDGTDYNFTIDQNSTGDQSSSASTYTYTFTLDDAATTTIIKTATYSNGYLISSTYELNGTQLE